MPAQDYDLWFRCFPLTKFHNLKEILLKNRNWEGQITKVSGKSGITTNRELLEKNYDYVFPSEIEKEIFFLNRQYQEGKSSLKTLYFMRKIAMALAKKHKSENTYFTSAKFYKEQRNYLLRVLWRF